MLLYCCRTASQAMRSSLQCNKSRTCARTLIGKYEQMGEAGSTTSAASWGYAGCALRCAQYGARQLFHVAIMWLGIIRMTLILLLAHSLS